ncbi:MAG TPA: PaaI family thioesterase [Novosphingobium sp.]
MSEIDTNPGETAAGTAPPIPAGFAVMDPFGPFHELVGPIYETRRKGLVVTGMRASVKHRNKGPIVHGGMLLALADTAMVRVAIDLRPADTICVTSSLSSELLSAARPGDWLEAEVEVLRRGRRLIALNCMIRRDGPDGELVMRASAIFQILAG